ncbi:organic hydroperoxide resistance protein [Silvimonas soli]|uniref:organic hydroperoxide resistance protein n=1 Tax=Silvimonas soli TaxID=2980100 RepID=UPI0024B36E2D|nr:organic hydroperoxide resistance protein [Silvimonas soli]
MTILYRTKATTHGGRNGRVESADGLFSAELAMPKELGGGNKVGTNPEQLFAAGYAACFESAIQFVAGQGKVKIGATQVEAEVGIGPRAEGGFKLEVSLKATVGGVDQATAEKLVATAHEVCPYSNATRGNIVVNVQAFAG